MTSAAPDIPRSERGAFDYKFWTVASLVVLVLFFNVAERLLLDADEADISFDRLIVPANRITDPHPGDVFVYNHADSSFVESKICSLQIFGAPEPVAERLRASNIWGSSLNATMATVGEYIGQKITGLATVKHAEREWTYFRTHRPQVRAPMEHDCLESVRNMMFNVNLTPFVVDAVYYVDASDGESAWVRFANPLILDPTTCGKNCPQPVSLKDIVQADKFTRFKKNWGLVHIE